MSEKSRWMSKCDGWRPYRRCHSAAAIMVGPILSRPFSCCHSIGVVLPRPICGGYTFGERKQPLKIEMPWLTAAPSRQLCRDHFLFAAILPRPFPGGHCIELRPFYFLVGWMERAVGNRDAVVVTTVLSVSAIIAAAILSGPLCCDHFLAANLSLLLVNE